MIHDRARHEANLALIVRAVNSHAALVAALRMMVTARDLYDLDRARVQARAALALAEGETKC